MRKVEFIGSFRFKLFSLLLALILIPLVVFSFMLFNWVKDVISEKYSESAIQSICQYSKNIDYRLNDIQEFSNIVLTNRDFLTMLKNKVNTEPYMFENQLREFFASREDIEGIRVYSGDSLYSVGSNKIAKENVDSQLYSELSKTNGQVKWINTRQEKVKIMAGDYNKYYFSLGRKLIDINTLESFGVLVIDIDEAILEKTYNNVDRGKDVEMFICDKDGNIISHPDKNKIGMNISSEPKMKEMLQDNKDFDKLVYNNGSNDSMMIYSKCLVTGWKLVQVIPNSYLYKEIDNIKYIVLVIGIVYVFIALITTLFFSIKLTKPMIVMMKTMKEAENGNLDVQLAVKSKDEIGQLGISFNSMICKIKALIAQLLEEERNKKEIELEALHAQINPHFLYNTLNTIKWMAKVQGAKSISSAITALIKLLRVSINLSNEMIFLEDEIQYVENYIHIQKIRFGGQFEITYSIDENCKKCYIPKLILQPIVENSIIYGTKEDAQDNLKIGIRAYIEGEFIIIQVIDNGKGIEEEVLKRIFKTEKNVNKFSSVGLNNVNQRIKHYFGEGYGINISSEINLGTSVRIILPYNVDGKEAENV
jgi:two-component system, sensor histidine kinase YesM